MHDIDRPPGRHDDKPTAPILLDPDSGAWALPPSSDDRYASGVSVWEEDTEGFRHFALFHIHTGTGITRDPNAEEGWNDYIVNTTIQFEPRPDNDYNSEALAIVVPDALRERVGAHHIGYMYDRNLDVFGPAIHTLMQATRRPVTCLALFHLSGPPPGLTEDYLEDWDIRNPSHRNAFTLSDFRETGLVPGKIRMRLPYYRDLNTAATDLLRTLDGSAVVPFEARRASVEKRVSETLPEDIKHKIVPATVRVEDDELHLYIEGHFVAMLYPHPREFFRRLHGLTVQNGGMSTTRAYISDKSVAVYTPDSRR